MTAPTFSARSSSPALTPVVLDALSVVARHAARLSEIEGIDVLWVAESVREAREVLDGLGPQVTVIDLAREDARLHLAAIGRSGGDAFTVVVAAADAAGLEPVRRSLGEGAFLCRSARIRELPKLLREIADAWS